MRKKLKNGVVFALMAATILVSGCGSKGNLPANDEPKAVPVSTVKVDKADISTKTVITGKITPSSEVMIVPKVGGKVTKVTVDVGSRVRKGDLLVQLDTTELNAQLRQAQAAVQLQRESAVQNDIRLQDARNNLTRMESLYKQGAISKQSYESALLQYNLLVNTPTQASVQSAQANVDYIKAQIANATITSPVNGEVSVKSIEVGELAGPTSPVITIVDTSKVYVEGVVTENDIPYVKQGQKVKIEIDALGTQSFEGTVTAISPAADPKTKGYQIKVEVPNADGKVKPGMFAEISITTQSKNGVVVVPKEALVSRGDKKYVYVVKDGLAVETEVVTGLEDDTKCEVVKGLNAGDQVVTLGQNSLSDKMKVEVKN